MSSSMVSAQLNSSWRKAVGHTQERPQINATLVRKLAVSKVHSQKSQLKGDLANLMCHSEDTAHRSYFLQEKSKNASSKSAALRTILCEEAPAEKSHELLIREYFSEETKKKKITLAVVPEKRTALSDLKHYSNLQLWDKIQYIIRTCEGGAGMRFDFIYFEII